MLRFRDNLMRALVSLGAIALAICVGCDRCASPSQLAPEPAPTAEDFERPDSPMALIPAGPFTKGCLPDDPYFCDSPRETVTLPAYRIDLYEVSAENYSRCVAARACPHGNRPTIEDGEHLPVQSVTWPEAKAYCDWMGRRLPTSNEWEKAARGSDARQFPWGDAWDPTRSNWCDGDECDGSVDGYAEAAPVDAFPGGVSPFGVYNMAGNVAEWTATPHPAKDGFYIVRGGAFAPPTGMGEPAAQTTWRESSDPPNVGPGHLGFRCAADKP
ncbi:MAG: SUMF1/EgtB/PvdO family nonheme iron enzyme [Deltaproteobacteria bacterium]|nr:SUMF1/EgtB/PvdO family nonheme iron enzyme [Deltaproteobacteria bacterium]